MKNISVIGSGTMGNGIAQTFALFNFNVKLYDINSENLKKGEQTILKNLQRMVNKEKITESEAENSVGNIEYTSDFNSILNADLVIEVVSENFKLKKSIFKELDLKCPKNTIIASNTSSISITKLAEATTRKDKVIGMHFMNPVPIMKLVEVINSKYTSKETTDMIITLSEQLEKIPLVVNDFPGFISNRILMPMINEAIESLDQGVADVKNIDGIMKLGMGHPMGPLQLADLIGLDVCKSILEVMLDGLKNPKYRPNKLLIELVNNGKLGIKSGEGFYDYSDSKKAEFVSKRFS
ncbi:MAG: 3-hydroxybutyryl-CoA dehydrogenase [Flavobacteriaceae bacterium]|jgi:3-hydroxybutyryl-CoA dehydrogenase|nr:3-hydroxybutyryl-CoA dehydrogenase [Flavobacteriaceae bacterium]OUV85839.1 MAG: 3-hydroxybutyryl-CoA dehydrogenase [Flavobacteriaceae bacterium TMED145]|tara:strand:+ start:28883 stop:29767 length:885 start_codon:yes stop_codon:yes gene_type:complete